jgi:hypothetical protein
VLLVWRFGRQIGRGLMWAAGLAAVVAVAWALASQAEANRQAAVATTVAAAGQTVATTIAAIMVALVVALALAVVACVLYVRHLRRRLVSAVAQAQHPPRVWRSGPNAQWERDGEGDAGNGVAALVPVLAAILQQQQALTVLLANDQRARPARNIPQLLSWFEQPDAVEGDVTFIAPPSPSFQLPPPADDWRST